MVSGTGIDSLVNVLSVPLFCWRTVVSGTAATTVAAHTTTADTMFLGCISRLAKTTVSRRGRKRGVRGGG